jgi:hypothetical protein
MRNAIRVCALMVASAIACGGLAGPGEDSAVVAIEIVTAPSIVNVGVTVQLHAIASHRSGVSVAGAPILWTSGAPDVLRVDSNGRSEALVAGSAGVTASVGMQSSRASTPQTLPTGRIR